MQRFLFFASRREWHVHPINVPECYAFQLAVLQNHLASNEQATVFPTSDYSDDEDDYETHSHLKPFRI